MECICSVLKEHQLGDIADVIKDMAEHVSFKNLPSSIDEDKLHDPNFYNEYVNVKLPWEVTNSSKYIGLLMLLANSNVSLNSLKFATGSIARKLKNSIPPRYRIILAGRFLKNTLSQFFSQNNADKALFENS